MKETRAEHLDGQIIQILIQINYSRECRPQALFFQLELSGTYNASNQERMFNENIFPYKRNLQLIVGGVLDRQDLSDMQSSYFCI